MAGKPNSEAPGDPATALEGAVRHLLRPLVRLLLAKGLPYPALSHLLKDIYFEIASQEVAPGDNQTASRISLITGLHRKDVRRLKNAASAPPAVSRELSLAAEVFTRWISDARFLNLRKQPLALPRLASTGGEKSFEFLAATVSKDVRARALLDELLRLELVRLDSQDRVVLNRNAFVPGQGSAEMAFYFGQNIHDHLSAAVHNMLGKDPMFLEQATFGDRLGAASVEEIAALVRAEWQKIVRAIVPKASELDDRDAKSGDTGMRMRFGIYFYSDKNKPQPVKGDDGESGSPGKARNKSPRSSVRRRKT